MAEIKDSPMPGSVSKGLDIEHIISAPLVAAATANSLMLRQQVIFLMEYCFEEIKSGEDVHYRPVMIQLNLSRTFMTSSGGENDTPTFKTVKTLLNVPLMTLVPLNSLGVDKVDIDFELELTRQSTEEVKTKGNLLKVLGDDESERQPVLEGKISYDAEDPSATGSKKSVSRNKSNMKIKVTAGALPLPNGTLSLLELFTKSIHPQENHTDKS
jgi:hypothetical protein